MASNNDKLTGADISQITDIVSAKNRQRFCVEYLGLDRNEYETIQDEAKFIHHDTLHECITRWKIREESQGKHPKDELVRILTQIRKEHGWFTGHDMTFLTDVTGMKIPESRLKKIQDWTKISLKTRLNKSLSHDWIHEKSAHRFPLRQYYIQLQWKKKVRTAVGRKIVTLMGMHDLVTQIGSKTSEKKSKEAATSYKPFQASSVIVEGEGGIGKTSSLGILALDWAEDGCQELQKFQFVFLILLRCVEGNEPLEEIIMKQHGRLKSENVSPTEVKAILHGQYNGHILLIFDGYDEYTEGCNEEIDTLLQNGKDNCMIIVSSRSGDFLHPIKSHVDEEVTITGFTRDNIIKCAEKYLGDKQSCKNFLAQAEQAGIHSYPSYKNNGLLHIPIILLMACAVFIENKILPSSKTDIFSKVVSMCISRTTLKTMGKTAGEIENLRELMVKLGKLSWEALNRKYKQLLLYKKDVKAESTEILKLGLLFGEDADATTTDPPEVLSFQHKLIQEYLAAVYLAEVIRTRSSTSVLEEALSSWEKIENHREVIHFACGMLAKDCASSHLINHVAKVLCEHVEMQLNEGQIFKLKDYLKNDLSLLYSFQTEGAVSSVNPYLTHYPSCCQPPAEVLAVITGIPVQNDTLQLNLSPANVMLIFDDHLEDSEFDRLCTTLFSIPENIIAMWLNLSRRADTSKSQLKHASRLKCLFIGNAEVSHLDELTVAIKSWSANPPLINCHIEIADLFTGKSLLTALAKCTHLRFLYLSNLDLRCNLYVFSASPPPVLEKLSLFSCILHSADIQALTDAFQEDKLKQLALLNLQLSPIYEVDAVNSLLQVISIKPHALKLIYLDITAIEYKIRLSRQFQQKMDEWKGELEKIGVNMHW